MKVAILNAFDIEGGAARAAYRLHQGLQTIGVNSQMLVQKKASDDNNVVTSQKRLAKEFDKFRATLDNLPLQLYSQRERIIFSSEWIPDSLPTRVAQLTPEIINLHWICSGYFQIETLRKFNQPVVWTLHDMWAFTGGCHYSQDCQRYQDSCGTCPILHSSKNWDLSRWIWQRKATAWKNINLTLVTPSAWLAKCASASSLFKDFRVEVIPNGLDHQRYKPMNRYVARQILNLPQDRQLILFGAMDATSDRRKGFHLLQPALQSLSQAGWQDQVDIVAFGASRPENPPELGFKSHYLGQLSDDISLALVYAAANVFVAPSIQDNLPNTIMEALACGTPCVAFNIGGMPDMIEHQQNGYLAAPFQVEDLAQGLVWVLENEQRAVTLSHQAREKVEQTFTLEIQARAYLKLFQELLQSSHLSYSQAIK